ncbi:MAG: acylphosphatase [Bacteroidota bacterium]
MQVGAKILISGLVQGVGFRYFVYHRAVSLGLQGYVRNLHSGDVEIYSEGNRSLIEELLSQIKIGPRAAKVNDVKIQWEDPTQNYQNFEIL